MAARKAIRAINWAALAERLPESEKNNFTAFKAKSDQYFRRVQANPETPPKIDWIFYKSKVAVPALVDKFQKEYEALKITYPEDKYTAQIEAQGKELEADVQKFIQESNERIKENKKEIKKLESLLKYGQMTMEDFKDAHPEVAIDALNRPTIYPHTSEYQPSAEDEKKFL